MTESLNRDSDDDSQEWLLITPEIQTALLIALLRRADGPLRIRIDELTAVAGVNWAVEAVREPGARDVVSVRLRRL